MIYIIRHGQTELNNAHVLQGRSDYPLNDKGIAQAREVRQWFTDQGIVFSYVYSSPLKRAVRTAEIITQERPVVVDDRLIEMDYGPYEGMDLENPAPEITTFFSDFVNNPAPEGMEPLSRVVQRTGAFLEDIKELSGNILISTHAIAMKGALEYLTPGSNGSYWSKYIGNCAVYAASNVDGQIGVPEEIKIRSGFMSLKETSKFMSLILRHKPEIINISLDEHGWADVSELIAGIAKTNDFSMDILEEIVRTDEKQRYSFNEDKTLIRANQGHSIPVDVELDEAEPPVELWHGTGEKFVASIDEQGLISKSRLYVHLSKDSDTAIKVGKRHGKPVLYIVKAAEMYKNGYKFYLSKNGVWLTKEVPVKYLVKQQR